MNQRKSFSDRYQESETNMDTKRRGSQERGSRLGLSSHSPLGIISTTATTAKTSKPKGSAPTFRSTLRVLFLIICCVISISSAAHLLRGYRETTVDNANAVSISNKLAMLDAALDALECGGSNGFNDDAAANCVKRMARDHSKKKQAHKAHWEENERLARQRASAASPYDPLARETSEFQSKFDDMDDRYIPKDKWITTNGNNSGTTSTTTTTGVAYPNIEIVGFPKAGTSQLYSILTNRPDTVRFNIPNKEFCSGTLKSSTTNEEIQKYLFDWHGKVFEDNKDRMIKTTPQQQLLSVNGCIWVEDAVLRHLYLNTADNNHKSRSSNKNRKVVVLFRDPADWMWASWNFWTDPNLDAIENAPGMWTQPSSNYRSPELFHEILSAGTQTTKQFPRRLVLFRQLSVAGVQKLWTAFGRDNVLMLKSEDMRPEVVNATGGFLDRLSEFTGLDKSLYNNTTIFRYSNCNDAKGADSSCGNNSGKSGSSSAYAIAGGRDMLPETRRLVYLYFWEECKIWSKEFGVHYPDCVNVLPPPDNNDGGGK